MTIQHFERFTHERRLAIVRILEEQQRVTVRELGSRLAVSEVTIRKDLVWLAAQRLIVRSYGGACLDGSKKNKTGIDNHLNPQQAGEKAIGVAAAALVQDGETIAIDGSTTALYLARALVRFKELTVVTYNLRCAMELRGRSGISVLMPGGRVHWGSLSLDGTVGENFFRQFHIKRLFVGAKDLDLNEGLGDENSEELSLRRTIALAAKEVVALIDQTKWNQTVFTTFCTIEHIKTIITGKGAPKILVGQARELGIEVLMV